MHRGLAILTGVALLVAWFILGIVFGERTVIIEVKDLMIIILVVAVFFSVLFYFQGRRIGERKVAKKEVID
ncbi:MAG: hypothetical protein Q7R31_01780 [Candidatus Levybacteria bacterium]|nr:hypothetical protein [Candidatus Levybacteria bacterium]